jgi:hypothetical protein
MSVLLIGLIVWLAGILLIMIFMARDLHRDVRAPTRPLRPGFELSAARPPEDDQT